MGSSRRDLRDRSMSKHTRATTVVNHPPRFSIASASEPLRRSQASWTASSASDGEPSIRYATTRSRALCASNCSASNLSSCINLHSWVSCPSRSHSRVVIRHNNDERTLNDVTARVYYPEHETPKRGENRSQASMDLSRLLSHSARLARLLIRRKTYAPLHSRSQREDGNTADRSGARKVSPGHRIRSFTPENHPRAYTAAGGPWRPA